MYGSTTAGLLQKVNIFPLFMYHYHTYCNSSCYSRYDSSLYRHKTGIYAGPNYCQSHVLVDTWMLTVKPVYKLKNMSDDKHTCDTINTHV